MAASALDETRTASALAETRTALVASAAFAGMAPWRVLESPAARDGRGTRFAIVHYPEAAREALVSFAEWKTRALLPYIDREMRTWSWLRGDASVRAAAFWVHASSGQAREAASVVELYFRVSACREADAPASELAALAHQLKTGICGVGDSATGRPSGLASSPGRLSGRSSATGRISGRSSSHGRIPRRARPLRPQRQGGRGCDPFSRVDDDACANRYAWKRLAHMGADLLRHQAGPADLLTRQAGVPTALPPLLVFVDERPAVPKGRGDAQCVFVGAAGALASLGTERERVEGPASLRERVEAPASLRERVEAPASLRDVVIVFVPVMAFPRLRDLPATDQREAVSDDCVRAILCARRTRPAPTGTYAPRYHYRLALGALAAGVTVAVAIEQGRRAHCWAENFPLPHADIRERRWTLRFRALRLQDVAPSPVRQRRGHSEAAVPGKDGRPKSLPGIALDTDDSAARGLTLGTLERSLGPLAPRGALCDTLCRHLRVLALCTLVLAYHETAPRFWTAPWLAPQVTLIVVSTASDRAPHRLMVHEGVYGAGQGRPIRRELATIAREAGLLVDPGGAVDVYVSPTAVYKCHCEHGGKAPEPAVCLPCLAHARTRPIAACSRRTEHMLGCPHQHPQVAAVR